MLYYIKSEGKVIRVQRLKKRDAIAALALILLVLVLGAGLLDRGHEWGDDFAAYMLQARAMANGTMEEQSRINRIIHASEMSFGGEEIPDTITYVWGYPLALSGIYRAIGYNPVDGGIPIAYKLPNLIGYALFAAIVYLFYRRRFSFGISLFLSSLFALHAQMLVHANDLMSDIFCLMLSMAALLLLEVFFEEERAGRKAAAGLLLGAILWYNYEVRLNGVTVIYIVIAAHALHLLRTRPKGREWAVQLAPYASLLALLGISLCLLPQATGNSSHIASGPNSQILFNLRYYNDEIAHWIERMIPAFVPLREYAYIPVYLLIAIGVVSAGIRKNLHLTALMLGTFAVLFLLPYVQPLRYLFNALPLMLLFAGYGAQALWLGIKEKLPMRAQRAMRWTGYAAMLLIAACMALDTAEQIGVHARQGGAAYRYEAYGEDALDIYAYIRENTAEDARIGCVKPRALTLNTDRICFAPGINGNRYMDMHYLLAFDGVPLYDSVTQSIWPELWEELTEVYRNDSFVLYELSENYRLTGKTE